MSVFITLSKGSMKKEKEKKTKQTIRKNIYVFQIITDLYTDRKDIKTIIRKFIPSSVGKKSISPIIHYSREAPKYA